MRIGDALLLGCFLLTVAVALPAALGEPLDVENLSMKSVGTDSAAAELVREREFGRQPVVILLARPATGLAWTPLDQDELDRWERGLAAHPATARLARVPVALSEAELALALVPRVDPNGRYADRADEVARFASETLPSAMRLHVAGAPIVELAVSREMSLERRRLMPVLLGALLLALLACYRDPVLVTCALIPPIGGVALLGGLRAVAGTLQDPVSSLLGPVVLTIGVAAAVHVNEHYVRARRAGLGRDAATRRGARELRFPMALTATTTVAGFLGLLPSPIPAVRTFGVWASAGVVLASTLAFAVQPAALRALDRRTRRRTRPERAEPGLATCLALWGLRRRRAALLVTAATLVAFGASWTRIGVELDPASVLPPAHRVQRDRAAVEEVLGVTGACDLLLGPGGPATPLAVPALLARLADVPGVAGIAGTRRSTSGYRLVEFLVDVDASAMPPVLEAVLTVAVEAGWSDARVTGLPARMTADSRALVRAQLLGLLSTLALLATVMALGFRSLRLALLGLVPNVLPCVLVYGGLSLFGRPLTVASAMIGSVLLGLVVDDTIHYLDRYRTLRARGLERARSLWMTSQSVGHAIVVTSFCLAVGFACMSVGSLETTREFATLATAVVGIALLADLVLVPALLATATPPTARVAGP